MPGLARDAVSAVVTATVLLAIRATAAVEAHITDVVRDAFFGPLPTDEEARRGH